MKRFAATIIAFVVMSPVALASGGSLKFSPKQPSAGSKVKVTGSVGGGCKGPATIYSKAFSTKHTYKKMPSVNAAVSNGKFSVKVKVKTSANGKVKVYGSCGGSQFASSSMKVFNNGGFYS